MMKRNLLVSFLTSVLMTALLSVTAMSQTGTSSVTGTIADQQGNIVAVASVRLIST